MKQPLHTFSRGRTASCVAYFLRRCTFKIYHFRFICLVLIGIVLFGSTAAAQLNELWRTAPLQAPERGAVRFIDQAVDKNNHLLILGTVENANSRSRVVLHKIDETGKTIWSRVYAGEKGSIADQALEFKIDSQGNSYIRGISDMAGDYKSFLLRYSPEGVLVWNKSNNPSDRYYAFLTGITVGKDDAIYAVGNRLEGEVPYVVTQKLTSDGNIAWEKKYPLNSPIEFYSSTLEVDAQGGVFVPIALRDYTAATHNILIKYNAANGEEIYVKEFGINSSNRSHEIEKIMIAPSGTISVIKSTEDAYYNVLTLYTLNASGNLINTTNIGDDLEIRYNPILYLRKTAFTRDGHLLILGINAVYRSTPDYFLEKYTSSGARVWQKTFNIYTEGSNIVKVFEPYSFDLNDADQIVLSGNYSEFIPSPSFWEDPEYIKKPKITLAVLDQSAKELQRVVSNKEDQVSNTGRGIDHIQKNEFYVTGLLDVPTSASLVAMKYGDCAGFTANAGQDKAICPGDKVQLEASGGTAYSWAPATGLSAANIHNPVASPEATTTYTVTITNANGCTATDQVIVTVNNKPIATITAEGSTSSCGGSVKITANAGTGLTYQWLRNGTVIEGATSTTYTASTSGNYAVTIRNSAGCTTTSAAKEVSISSTFTVNAGENQTVCANVAAFNLTGFSPAGGTWSGKGVTANGSFDPANAGAGAHTLTYSVTKDNCTITDSRTVTVSAAVSKPGAITGNTTLCAGTDNETYSIGEVAGATEYIWSAPDFDIRSGQGTRTIKVKAGTSSGKLSVVAKNGCGTSAASELEVTVNAIPEMNIVADGSRAFCEGGSVKLSVNAGNNLSYQWARDGQNISGATSATYTATAAGSYTVKVANGTCSSTTAAIKVEVASAISNNAISSNQTVCAGSRASAITGSTPAGGNSTFAYQWESSTNEKDFTAIQGATGKNLEPENLTTTTWFRRKVTSGSCIHFSTAVKITVTAAPSVSLAVFESVCIDAEPVALAGGSPAGGVYSGNGVSNGVFDPKAAGAGTHTVTYTFMDGNGCSASTTQPILVKSDCQVTGVEDEEPKYKLLIFPNPTRSVVSVQLELQKRTNLTIRIVDARGRIIGESYHKQVMGEFRKSFDLKNVAKGMYLMQFMTDDGVKTRRIVVQ